MSVYSIIFSVIETYSGLFRHTQHPVWYSHIRNLAIFWTLTYLERKTYLKFFETLTRHIHNFSPLPYGIIQPCSGTFRTLCNACTRRNLEYSESCNIQNPSIIASRRIFRNLLYKGVWIFRTWTYSIHIQKPIKEISRPSMLDLEPGPEISQWILINF